MDDRSVLLDTNVLLDATTPARALHGAARRVLDEWPNRGLQLCISGQILREYLVVATRDAEVNGLGLGVEDALANSAAFKGRCRFLSEDRDVAERLHGLLGELACSGKQIHDANLVATCLVHGVPAIVTANTGDFERFGSLIEVRPPGD
ncbi:MAG: PIN domain-containing protein [Acidobacteriota bacterium]|jgi:predicted nucleic acid-binding protein